MTARCDEEVDGEAAVYNPAKTDRKMANTMKLTTIAAE